jgi:transposase
VGKTHAPYAPEFRAEAVRLVRESGRPLAHLAKDLGVSEPTLRQWLRGLSSPAAAVPTKDQGRDEAIRRLEREVQRLREERDILKKSAAFFAQEAIRRGR